MLRAGTFGIFGTFFICAFVHLYRVSLKKGNFSDFRLNSVLKVGFYFSHVFWNQNSEPLFYLFTKEVCVMHTSLNFVHTINTYFVKCILNIVKCKVQ